LSPRPLATRTFPGDTLQEFPCRQEADYRAILREKS
jgi:hypothetical protein